MSDGEPDRPDTGLAGPDQAEPLTEAQKQFARVLGRLLARAWHEERREAEESPKPS